MDIDVFISYHTDTSLYIAERIACKLEEAGVRCWYAERDSAGAFAGSIGRAIAACRLFLLILNEQASSSPQVLNEMDLITNRLVGKEDVTVLPFLIHGEKKDLSLDAQYYVGRMDWVDGRKEPMHERIDELVVKVLHILGQEDTTQQSAMHHPARHLYELVQKIPEARDIFLGREDLIEQMEDIFRKGTRILFLEGIGGIGKSELAKQYALRHRDAFDQLLFVTYTTNLRSLVCDTDLIEIKGCAREEGEPEDAWFARKLQALRSLTSSRTLIITDNYDIDDDPDFAAYTEGNCRMIFTSRNAHPGHASLKVGPIEDDQVLFTIFEKNYGSELSEEDREAVREIFRLTEYHTYTIELLAKQMEASFLSGMEMLDLLKKGQLETGAVETVNGRAGSRSAFEHIRNVFSVSRLSEEEQQLMRYLSLMGSEGVPAVRFKEWAGLDNYEAVNRLVRRSWIRKERGRRFTLHPLVAEVIRASLQPDADNCYAFLERLTEYTCTSWYRPFPDNMEIKSCVLSVENYFRPFDGEHMELWMVIPNFLWQVGAFEESIEYAQIVFQTCKKMFGENHPYTGYAAKGLAGCYYNSGYREESIPWYDMGLRCMVQSGMEESEDLAIAYEKAGRCRTWEGHRDLAKAEEYLKKALEIRLKLVQRLESGEKLPALMEREPYDLAKARDRLGGSYFELGRMCQAGGDYHKAWEYLALDEEVQGDGLKEWNPSGYAYILYDKGICEYHFGKEEREAGHADQAEAHFRMALDFMREALDINLRLQGRFAVDTIDAQEAVGDIYAAMELYGDAANAYMAALTMVEKTMGENSERAALIKRKLNFD